MIAADNVLRDPIPNGLFDASYRIRAFVTVPDFQGWRPEDRIQILGLETGNPEDAFSDMPGVYLKANRLYGTHALTAGMAIVAGTRYCVEVASVVNGVDGSIDQTVEVDGVLVGTVTNADPNFDAPPFTRDPPSAALAGVSPSTNTQIAVILGDPVWNTAPIGCASAEEEGTGDPIYPGENGYPFLPGDAFYGEPYWPPDTTPLVVGMPGYPYAPDDPRYGDLYYPPPPTGTGSSGTVAVALTAPADGTTLSDDPLLIQASTLELSASGGIPLVEIWLDSRKLGEAYGTPPLFFWEWFGTKPGPHQLRALAKSTSGARVYSAPRTVYVPDISPPDVAFLSPPVGAPLAGIVEVAVEAEDDVDVERVEFFVDGFALGVATRPPYRVTLDLDDLTEDEHELLAVAYDTAGNSASTTRLIDTEPVALAPWVYATMASPPPRLSVEIDFVNDPFVSPLSTAILGSQPWSYLPMSEVDPEASVFTEDLSGLIHSGRLFGTWAAAPGGGFRTTALRTSGIVIPAPARRPSFAYGILVRPHDFAETIGMRLLDTGGLRLVLGLDGSLYVEGGISTSPNLVPAGIPAARHVALIYDADVPSVGTTAHPALPGPLSHMAILVDGVVVALKAPLDVGDVLMMARSPATEWVVGGGAGDVTLDEAALWMRPLDASELQGILATRGNPPTPVDTWTDVTARVRDVIDARRGRGGEAEHGEVGQMFLTFANDDRALEPEFADSPYFPGVTSNRKIRLRAFHDGVWKPLWRGYVLKWPQTWGLRRSTVTVECAGNFVRFGHASEVSGDYPAELTGARVDRVLDAAAVPSSERLLDEGKLTLLAHRVERSDARSYADQAVDSELGILFEDSSGRIVFHDRDHRVTDERSVVPRFWLGDGGPPSGELPIAGGDPDYDPDRIFNDVRVEWPRGVTQVAVDGASVRQFGRKDIVVQTLLVSELSAARLARTILDLTSQPRWSYPALTIRPTRLDDLWFVALDTEISDRHIVRRRPVAGGALLELPVYVEAIQHSIEVGKEGLITNWMTTFVYSTIGHAAPVPLIPYTTVVAPPAAAIAASVAPTLVKTSNPTIAAKPARAIAASYPSVSVRVSAPAAAATASASPPALVVHSSMLPPPAIATATFPPPVLSARTLLAPSAAGTATLPTPVVKITMPAPPASATGSLP